MNIEIELIVVRDPDGPVQITVFVDGVEHPAVEHVIDAGVGWEWKTWKESRNKTLDYASPAARSVLKSAYTCPPGGKYIQKPDSARWLDGVPDFEHDALRPI
ncbi:hypothetical protein [Nocardia alni]|uniref:hypothetical protein n=1 Tax=Nocardia alni TaxID=2815723 RepID=UPI001C211C01|nr:hypothetical protein [Nocardia alni]